MTRKYNMYSVLRLMTLLSTTNSGLKQAEFDQLRRAFIMCYGYKEISTILNLQDSRLLKVRDKRFDWNKIRSVSPPVHHHSFITFCFIRVGIAISERRGRRATVDPLRIRLDGSHLCKPALAHVWSKRLLSHPEGIIDAAGPRAEAFAEGRARVLWAVYNQSR